MNHFVYLVCISITLAFLIIGTYHAIKEKSIVFFLLGLTVAVTLYMLTDFKNSVDSIEIQENKTQATSSSSLSDEVGINSEGFNHANRL